MIKLKLGVAGIVALVAITAVVRYVHPGPVLVWLILLAGALMVAGLMWLAIVDPPMRTKDRQPTSQTNQGHPDHVTLTETRERITRSVSGPAEMLRQLMPGTAWGNRTQEIEITNGEITNE